MLSDLESEDEKTRHAAADEVLHRRDISHDDIRALAEKHIQGGKGMVARDALRLLGRLQAREQVPFLVERMHYQVPELQAGSPLPTIESTFPAAGALIDIGLPSIKPVLARLEHEKDGEALVAGAGVLMRVLGRGAALKRVRAELAASRSDDARAAFQRILELFDREFLLQ